MSRTSTKHSTCSSQTPSRHRQKLPVQNLIESCHSCGFFAQKSLDFIWHGFFSCVNANWNVQTKIMMVPKVKTVHMIFINYTCYEKLVVNLIGRCVTVFVENELFCKYRMKFIWFSRMKVQSWIVLVFFCRQKLTLFSFNKINTLSFE